MTGGKSGDQPAERALDFLAVGEAVIDLISDEAGVSLVRARNFTRFAGGQASNLAVTMSRLGRRSAAAVCVGEDSLGRFFIRQLEKAGVWSDLVQVSERAPTSLVLIGRHTETPEFIAFRGADSMLALRPDLRQAAANCRVVHTSAFALSRQPARETILECLQIGGRSGALITVDPNFHPRIWPDQADLRETLAGAFAFADLTKPSLDDAERIFGPGLTPAEYAACFIEWGARTVVLTMGRKGALLACAGQDWYQVPSLSRNVVDVTGAGDAFWAGYIDASLNGQAALDAACFGQVVAAEKLKQLGPVKRLPEWDMLAEKAARLKDSVLVQPAAAD